MIFQNAEQIEASIKRISTAGKKLDADIQAAGLGCINHIDQHGDVRLVNRLYLAMPKGSRKTALAQWLLAFGKVSANTTETKKDSPFVYAKDKPTMLAEAATKPWYDFAPEKAPDELFDVMKALEAVLNRAGKAGKVSDPDLLSNLRALVAGQVEEKEEA